MSYMGTHNRVRRIKGSACGYQCVACEAPAKEWAYSNASPNEEVDAQGRRYSQNLDDYQPMCFRCHRLYDKATITHCPHGHAYEGDNVILDAGKRKCRTCVYERNRRRRREFGLTPEQHARRMELQRQRRAKAKAAA